MAISSSLLASRQVREGLGLITKIKSGLRTEKDEQGNIILRIYNAIEQWGQSLMKFAMSQIVARINTIDWDLFVTGITYLWNFNWNVSDDELDQQVDQGWAALSAQLGGTLGNAAGHLICGVLPGVFMLRINIPLALKILKEEGEELFDELAANLGMLIRSLIATTSRAIFSYSFKKIRKTLFPDRTGKHKPWSFAIGWDNFLDSIDDNRVRQYTEEAAEEAWEACVQAGFIVASAIDSHYALQGMDKSSQLGDTKIVEIQFSRDNDD